MQTCQRFNWHSQIYAVQHVVMYGFAHFAQPRATSLTLLPRPPCVLEYALFISIAGCDFCRQFNEETF